VFVGKIQVVAVQSSIFNGMVGFMNTVYIASKLKDKRSLDCLLIHVTAHSLIRFVLGDSGVRDMKSMAMGMFWLKD